MWSLVALVARVVSFCSFRALPRGLVWSFFPRALSASACGVLARGFSGVALALSSCSLWLPRVVPGVSLVFPWVTLMCLDPAVLGVLCCRLSVGLREFRVFLVSLGPWVVRHVCYLSWLFRLVVGVFLVVSVPVLP